MVGLPAHWRKAQSGPVRKGASKRRRALPHAGLVGVPVVARFHDFGLELREDNLKRLDGVLLWSMGRIECKHYAGC